MRKYIKVVLIILVLISILWPITYSYAIDNKFFEISKLEVTKKEDIEMTINLEQIKYDKFIFELKSDENMEKLEVKEEQVDVEKEDNEIVMEVDKKSNQLKNITLYYTIPDNKKAGDKIKFIATITNTENKEETESIELYVEIIDENINNPDKIEDNKENNVEDNAEDSNKNEEQLTKPENTVIENNKQEISEENNSKPEQQNNENSQKSNVNTAQKATNNISVTTSNQKNIETVTYNGSNNNYLSELSIENYSLNKEFSKENTTYFLSVENEIEKLNVIANAEEENATVCVYGNEDLQEGSNKILISVTAENGNVRYYRIYINQKA